jgi:hypothetical protein
MGWMGRIVQAPVVVVLFAAAVVTVGAGPAVAGRTTSSDDLMRLRPAASAEVMVQTCTARRPVGWWLKGGYPNPQGCLKCESAGRFWEATGNYRAWCSKEANGAILWLFCTVCRKGDSPAAHSTDPKAGTVRAAGSLRPGYGTSTSTS